MEGLFGWCAKLTEAVNVAMNPEVPHDGRFQAYQLCEQFKESAPFSECMACGMQLAGLDNTTVIRHFGLQLLEHGVKFQWNSAGPTEKVYLKENLLQLFKCGTQDLLMEQMCIKDGLTRVMVEMIKREWPQQWPSLLTELNLLCSVGETQTELVLLVLLRLVEDVVTFQNLQTSRRRDVLQALTSNMAELFKFMLELLTHNVDVYKQCKLLPDAPESETKIAVSIRVCQAVLLTLTGYVEWVSFQHIFADNNTLLSTLYGLLNIVELKLPAVEVLQLIVNRKGRLEERHPLFVLFGEEAIRTILSAAKEACAVQLDTNNYIFLKRLCQVFTGLGAQLCILWGSEIKEVHQPETFEYFLLALLAFLGHPSMHLSSMIVPLLSAFFRHDLISVSKCLHSIIPQILEMLVSKLQKNGYPSREDSQTCAYSLLDYDSDEEFNHSFAIYRSHQTELVRLITDNCPQEAFHVVYHWFKKLLESPAEVKSWQPGSPQPQSSAHIEWDAMTCFLESVLSRLFHSKIFPTITPQLIQLLQMALAFQTKDPAVLSCVLSTISTLFPIVKEKHELVNAFIDKIFVAAVFTQHGQTKKTRPRPVQNVRRHACCALLKICRDYSKFMVNFFEPLYNRIKALHDDPGELTQMEKSTLNEALILLSNEFHDLNKQSILIQEILHPVATVWLGDTIKEVLRNEVKFRDHIGLSQVAASSLQEDQEGANRATILASLSNMLAVVKRAKFDPQKADASGLFSSTTNPCFQHILPLLDNVIALLRTMNALWAPNTQAEVPLEYAKVFEIPENDKNAVMGLNLPYDNYELPANRSTSEKIQGFLSTAHENSCHILASAFDTIGNELYSCTDVISQLKVSLSSILRYTPDNRLRPFIRIFLKSLVQHCSVAHQDEVLLPVVHCLCDYMLRLRAAWESTNKRLADGEETDNRENNQDMQEILDELFLRLITRDFLDLITTMFRKRRDSSESISAANDNGIGDQMELTESDSNTSGEEGTKVNDYEQISELGKKILGHESMCTSMVVFIYSSFAWNDTQTCIKSLNICWLIFQQIVEKPLLPGAANYILTSLLQGLHTHGQHDACMTWLIQKTSQHYLVLRPKFDAVQQVMLQIPGVTLEAIQSFENRYIFNKENKRPVSLKGRRDNFKKLVSGVIGRPIGEMFKQDIIIKNLQPINKPVKPVAREFVEFEQDLGLIALFAHPQ